MLPASLETFITLGLSSTNVPSTDISRPQKSMHSPSKENGIVGSKPTPDRRPGRSFEPRSSMKQVKAPSFLNESSPSSPASSKHRRGPTTESRASGSQRPASKPSTSARRRSASPSSPQNSSRARLAAATHEIPMYMSRFQRVSTNSSLDVDVQAHEFAEWADVHGSSMTLSIWARTMVERNDSDVNETQEDDEETAVDDIDLNDHKLLHTWRFDISDLVPLSDYVSEIPFIPHESNINAVTQVIHSPVFFSFYGVAHRTCAIWTTILSTYKGCHILASL